MHNDGTCPEKQLNVIGDFYGYYEYTEDPQAIKRCFEQMAQFCIDNKEYCFNYVKLIIRGSNYARPSIGIKWHVGKDEH